MFGTVFKDIQQSFGERLKNPYWFTLIILLVYYNWEFLITLMYIGTYDTNKEKIEAISKYEISFWWPLALAFAYLLLYYVVHYFGLIASVLFEDNVKPILLEKFGNKRIVSKSRHKDLQERYQILADENEILEKQSRISIKEKELRIDKLNSQLEFSNSQLTTVRKENGELIDEIKLIEKENADSKEVLIRYEGQLNQKLLSGKRGASITIDQLAKLSKNFIYSLNSEALDDFLYKLKNGVVPANIQIDGIAQESVFYLVNVQPFISAINHHFSKSKLSQLASKIEKGLLEDTKPSEGNRYSDDDNKVEFDPPFNIVINESEKSTFQIQYDSFKDEHPNLFDGLATLYKVVTENENAFDTLGTQVIKDYQKLGIIRVKHNEYAEFTVKGKFFYNRFHNSDH